MLLFPPASAMIYVIGDLVVWISVHPSNRLPFQSPTSNKRKYTTFINAQVSVTPQSHMQTLPSSFFNQPKIQPDSLLVSFGSHLSMFRFIRTEMTDFLQNDLLTSVKNVRLLHFKQHTENVHVLQNKPTEAHVFTGSTENCVF